MASTKVNARRNMQPTRTTTTPESPTKSGSGLRRHHTLRDEEDISTYRDAINARTPGRLKIPAVFLSSNDPTTSSSAVNGSPKSPNVSRSFSMRNSPATSSPVSRSTNGRVQDVLERNTQPVRPVVNAPLKSAPPQASPLSSMSPTTYRSTSKTETKDSGLQASRDVDSAYSSSISFDAHSAERDRHSSASAFTRQGSLSNRLPSTDTMDPKYEGFSEEQLQFMLREAKQFEERRKIRAAIRCLRSEGSGSFSDYTDVTTPTQNHRPCTPPSTLVTDSRHRNSLTGQHSQHNGFGKDKDEEVEEVVFKTSVTTQLAAPVSENHQPRLPSLSQLPPESIKSEKKSMDKVDITGGQDSNPEAVCDDLEVLEKLLDDTTDLGKRREIRATIRELRRQVRDGGTKPRPPSFGQPISVKVSEKQLNGGREVTVDCKQQNDDELKNVRSVTRLERTDSQSKVQTKATTVRSHRRTLGGTEYEELNAKVTRSKVTRQGSTYTQREELVEKRIHPPHGDDRLEKDMSISLEAANADGVAKFRESVSAHTGVVFDRLKEKEAAVKPVAAANSKPTFLAPVSDVNLETDQEVNFYCCVQSPGDDKPLFDIFYGSRRLAVILDYSKSVNVRSIGDKNFVLETSFRLTELAHPSIEGVYKLRVRNLYGIADCSFRLSVEETSVLSITLPLDDVAVTEGERIILTCTASGLRSDADIQWKCPSSTGKRNTRVFPQTGLLRLEVPTARITDCGDYQVTIRQGGQQVSSRANVDVRKNCRPPVFKRSLPQQLTLNDDEDLVLTCEVDDSDDFTFSWEKDGVRLQHDGSLIFSRRDGGRLELRIRGVDTDCNGSYRVVVQNPAGRRSCTAFVNVRDREPVALALLREPEDVTVSCDEDACLECVLREEDPRAVAVWFLNSQPLSSRPNAPDNEQRFDGRRAKLLLRGLKPEHSGVYSCGIKNNRHTCICQSRVTVRPPPPQPRFATRLKDQRIRDGDTLILECTLTERIRDGRVTWFLNDEDISGTEGQRMEFNGSTARLIVWDVFEEDCGIYRCLVNAPGGKTECSARVRMQEAPPAFSSGLGNVCVTVGDSTRLTATLEASIPGARVSWTFRGRPAAGVTNFDGRTTSLVIGPLSERQAGPYTVRVTSADGQRWCESTCNVAVETPKPKMSDEVDIETCNDEEALTKLLGKTDNMDKRRQIRARLKTVRDEAKKVMEERRKAREQVGSVDAVRSRTQMAEEEKQRKLKAYQAQAKAAGQTGPKTDAVKAMAERAAVDKAERMKQFDELAKTGGPVAFQGGLDSVKKMEQEHAEKEKQRALQQFSNMQKNMNTKAQDEKPIPRVQNKGGPAGVSFGTRAGQKPAGKSPMNAFKAMDKQSNPEGAKKPNFMSAKPARGGVTRNPSAIKQMLLEWCKAQVKEYENVNITNFGSSWADGLAFCALIHHFYPDAFDFNALSPKNRRENFQLAFDTAEKLADICPLLDVEDMVMMKVPDWKCVFTQIQSYYRTLRTHDRNALKAQEARAQEAAHASEQ